MYKRQQFDYILGDDVTEDNPLEVIVKLEAPETIAHVNIKIEAVGWSIFVGITMTVARYGHSLCSR